MLPRHLNFPLTIIAKREHRTSHSAMECDVNRIALPCFLALIMLFQTIRRFPGSKKILKTYYLIDSSLSVIEKMHCLNHFLPMPFVGSS